MKRVTRPVRKTDTGERYDADWWEHRYHVSQARAEFWRNVAYRLLNIALTQRFRWRNHVCSRDVLDMD